MSDFSLGRSEEALVLRGLALVFARICSRQYARVNVFASIPAWLPGPSASLADGMVSSQ